MNPPGSCMARFSAQLIRFMIKTLATPLHHYNLSLGKTYRSMWLISSNPYSITNTRRGPTELDITLSILSCLTIFEFLEIQNSPFLPNQLQKGTEGMTAFVPPLYVPRCMFRVSKWVVLISKSHSRETNRFSNSCILASVTLGTDRDKT